MQSGDSSYALSDPVISATRARRTILIVEDDFDVRFALHEALVDAGHTVQHATDGAQALRGLRAGPLPDLIILDLMMRGMNGREFRRAQLHDPALAGIPVLLVSAVPNIGREARELGATRALQKPIRLDELLEAVAHCHPPDNTGASS